MKNVESKRKSWRLSGPEEEISLLINAPLLSFDGGGCEPPAKQIASLSLSLISWLKNQKMNPEMCLLYRRDSPIR